MTEEQRKEAKHRVKARLGEYLHLEKERQQLIEEMRRLEAKRYAPGTSKLDAMPRGGSSGDPVAASLFQKEALQERYARKVAEMEATQSGIEDMIESLSSVERKLLRHRYIEGLMWEKICVAMSYSWRQTHNIHSAALEKLIDLYNE